MRTSARGKPHVDKSWLGRYENRYFCGHGLWTYTSRSSRLKQKISWDNTQCSTCSNKQTIMTHFYWRLILRFNYCQCHGFNHIRWGKITLDNIGFVSWQTADFILWNLAADHRTTLKFSYWTYRVFGIIWFLYFFSHFQSTYNATYRFSGFVYSRTSTLYRAVKNCQKTLPCKRYMYGRLNVYT